MAKRVPVNRRSVSRCIRRGDTNQQPITGLSMRDIAVGISAHLGTHPSTITKIEEIVEHLIEQGVMVHRDAVLRPPTDEERKLRAERHERERINTLRSRRLAASQRQAAFERKRHVHKHTDTLASA